VHDVFREAGSRDSISVGGGGPRVRGTGMRDMVARSRGHTWCGDRWRALGGRGGDSSSDGRLATGACIAIS
jgi:hypothetical protein